MKVCVLGAGIIGATTAYRLLEEFSDGALEVDVIAEAYSPNTTTDVSAGFWLPFIPGGTSDSDLEYVVISFCIGIKSLWLIVQSLGTADVRLPLPAVEQPRLAGRGALRPRPRRLPLSRE